MCSDSVIQVHDVSKRYEIYDKPRDRLKQFLLPRLLGAPGRRYFREFWALKDISFEVKKGESVGIIGRNGSGKSTLLQIVTGTLAPTSGTVRTSGRIAALLELGSGFNPEFTGRENVYLNGALLGLTKEQIDQRFDDIAAFADIGEHLEQPVKTYSSGMLVRLAFAVQVQVEPDILIVDEALAVGDALFQKRCFQRIEKLTADGTTLLFVSHDQESVRTLTNRALLLNKGQALAWGTSSEVVLKYRKLLHEEEAAYFAKLTQDMVNRSHEARARGACANAEDTEERSDRLSFGDGEVRIKSVEVLDAEGCACSMFYVGERVRIRVVCECLTDMTNLNVGLRIRNKEGVKVYSWGTLNQDMAVLNVDGSDLFWNRSFSSGEVFSVDFTFECALGTNLYEVQAAVSEELTPDYTAQRILHWIDEAAFFQSNVNRERNFFGGLTDLRMRAEW